jgi:putative peptidoglycan lipid II flippase
VSVARSSFVFAAGTFLSRISGVLRESVAGAVFGASVYMDAFVVAFRIPNLLRDLLAEGALGSSFTKVYASLSHQSGSSNPSDDFREEASQLLVQTLQLVVMVSIGICALGILFSGSIVSLMISEQGPSDSAELQRIATGLTQVMFPFIGFASLGAVIQGALYQQGKFFLVGVAPILFNLFSVAGALWFGGVFDKILPDHVISYFGNSPILGFAVGTLLGGAAQAAVQLWGIWTRLLKGKSLLPKSFPWSENIKKVLLLMSPLVIASSAGQINMMVNTNFATSLETGAATWLSFAFRVLQLPIGIFGVAVGAAVLPALARKIKDSGGQIDAAVSQETFNALDLVIWLMVPCMLFMYGSALDITKVIFQAGRFSEADSQATASAIQAYSLGLVGYGVLKVLNSYYIVRERTSFPMYVGLASIAVNYAANALLVQRFGHQGLALTASFILTANATILMIGTTPDRLKFETREVIGSLLRLVAAVSGVFLLRHFYQAPLQDFSLSRLFTDDLTTMTTKIDSSLRLAVDGATVVVIFAGVGLNKIGKSPREALKMLRKKR